ncbi:hypothetical protein B4U37_19825 [Sutcliffiella horikoshii]|uniref:Glycosyltransferase RgtA/B/C/D-like domain-containing protein n=1 Tax=Sutcliffiella horikoshii TaxID=79883 RepID=A0ABM6KNS8_9BACI|nr:hypothetical protein [Sutcliffiella horikoshii]ART78149.1 hypothetical protein B4U37_19825 [Sutcliffiella horikoshii]
MRFDIFRFLEKFIYVIFFCVIALLVGINIFVSKGHQSIGQFSPNYFEAVTFIIALMFLAGIFRFRHPILKTIAKIPAPLWVGGFLIGSLLLQLTISKLFVVHPTWDFGSLVNAAKKFIDSGEVSNYFSIYPNNVFLFCILVIVGKIFTPDLITYMLFNSFIILISQYLIYRIATKVAGKTAGMISIAVSVLFFPYIFFAPIVYTDTISLIFLLLPLNLLIDKNGRFKNNIYIILAASVVFAFGMLLKGSLIIFVIAFGITLLLSMKGWKKVYFIVPFIVLFVIKTLFNVSLYQLDILDKEQQKKTSFPVSHWLVMAQNKDRLGKFSENDVKWTLKLLAERHRSEVSEIHYEELKQRIGDKGVYGNLMFNLEKIKHTWTDGTYYSLNKLRRHPLEPENFQRLVDYKSGELLQGFARVQHLILLMGLLFVVPLLKEKKTFVTFCMLAIIGYFFFFLLWETRSRYLVSVTPLIILLSSMAYFRVKGDSIDEKTP